MLVLQTKLHKIYQASGELQGPHPSAAGGIPGAALTISGGPPPSAAGGIPGAAFYKIP